MSWFGCELVNELTISFTCTAHQNHGLRKWNKYSFRCNTKSLRVYAIFDVIGVSVVLPSCVKRRCFIPWLLSVLFVYGWEPGILKKNTSHSQSLEYWRKYITYSEPGFSKYMSLPQSSELIVEKYIMLSEPGILKKYNRTTLSELGILKNVHHSLRACHFEKKCQILKAWHNETIWNCIVKYMASS